MNRSVAFAGALHASPPRARHDARRDHGRRGHHRHDHGRRRRRRDEPAREGEEEEHADDHPQRAGGARPLRDGQHRLLPEVAERAGGAEVPEQGAEGRLRPAAHVRLPVDARLATAPTSGPRARTSRTAPPTTSRPGGRDAAWRRCDAPRRARRGFSLIEIMVVIAIVGLLMGASVYGFRSIAKSELRSSSAKLAGAIRYCFDRAVTTGAYFRTRDRSRQQQVLGRALRRSHLPRRAARRTRPARARRSTCRRKRRSATRKRPRSRRWPPPSAGR